MYIKLHNLYAIVCCLDKEMKSAKSKVVSDAITRSWSVSIRERGEKKKKRITRILLLDIELWEWIVCTRHAYTREEIIISMS